MNRREIESRIACGLISLTLIIGVSLPTELIAANKAAQSFKKPIRNPKFDPAAEQVDLFDAVDAGQVTVKLIPKSAQVGTVFIENKTGKPLTVKIPEAVAAVSIHAQIGNPGAGNLGLGFGNPGNGNQAGAPQKLGGGIGQAPGNGPGAGNGPVGQVPGGGFFSIPAEKVVTLHLNSVCLEHGKIEPSANSKYTLVPINRVTRDPVLHQLLAVVGSGKVDSKASQAAAWHLANKMSFQTLAEKTTTPLGTITQIPDFTREQIQTAEQLVADAKHRAAEANLIGAAEPNAESDSVDAKPVRLATK